MILQTDEYFVQEFILIRRSLWHGTHGTKKKIETSIFVECLKNKTWFLESHIHRKSKFHQCFGNFLNLCPQKNRQIEMSSRIFLHKKYCTKIRENEWVLHYAAWNVNKDSRIIIKWIKSRSATFVERLRDNIRKLCVKDSWFEISAECQTPFEFRKHRKSGESLRTPWIWRF